MGKVGKGIKKRRHLVRKEDTSGEKSNVSRKEGKRRKIQGARG
jgi:hypothetical protein